MRIKKLIKYLLYSVLLVSTPWILLIVTVALSGGTIAASHPIWTDELGYWHEILSFTEKGLSFGYYTMDEKVPQILSFGTHGFGTISAYSIYASILGWGYNSMVIANCLFVSIAFILVILVVRPSSRCLVLLSVFYLSYVPLIFYSSTSMSELLNYSLLIIYMSLLYLFLKLENKSNWIFILLFILCIYLSAIRIIYIVLLLPMLLEKGKTEKVDLSFWKVTVIWVILSVLLYFTMSKFTAPYPISFLAELLTSPSLGSMISLFFKHAFDNTVKLFSPVYESPIQVFLRYTVIISIAYFLWKSNLIQSKFQKWRPLYLYLFFLLFSFVLITVLAYDIFDWRDFRVFAPVLFSTLFIASLYDEKVLKFAIAANVVSLLLLFSVNVNGFFDKQRYDEIQPNLDLQAIKYTSETQSPFENTLLLDSLGVNYAFSIPAGIGISFKLGEEISDSVKSRYIYTNKVYKLKTYSVVSSSLSGTLYKKIDAE